VITYRGQSGRRAQRRRTTKAVVWQFRYSAACDSARRSARSMSTTCRTSDGSRAVTLLRHAKQMNMGLVRGEEGVDLDCHGLRGRMRTPTSSRSATGERICSRFVGTGDGMTVRPEIRARFRQVVARGLERADREHAEHLTRIRELPAGGGPKASRARIGELVRAQCRRP
jgi:hypothetical protein